MFLHMSVILSTGYDVTSCLVQIFLPEGMVLTIWSRGVMVPCGMVPVGGMVRRDMVQVGNG